MNIPATHVSYCTVHSQVFVSRKDVAYWLSLCAEECEAEGSPVAAECIRAIRDDMMAGAPVAAA